MTKSPNTKNEQQKDLCITSEQLTEQWKKGKLPSRDDDHRWLAYYIKHKDGYIHADSLWRGHWGTADRNSIEQILAPVPSYEEWQASEKYNKHLEEVIKVYERKDKQATETSIAYNELLEDNTKLKELLRECRPALVRFVSYDDSEENARILLMNEINEVLK